MKVAQRLIRKRVRPAKTTFAAALRSAVRCRFSEQGFAGNHVSSSSFREQTFGATRMTLTSFLKSTPSFCITPSRKPWDSPSVLFGFIAAKMRGYRSACRHAEPGIHISLLQHVQAALRVRRGKRVRVEACSVRGASAGSVLDYVHHCGQE